MRWVKTILWMIIFLFAVLFSMHNKEEVTLSFGFYPFWRGNLLAVQRVPLFIPILFAILLGILISGTTDLLRRLQLKRHLRQTQKTIERLEGEIDLLRRSSLTPPLIETPHSEEEKH